MTVAWSTSPERRVFRSTSCMKTTSARSESSSVPMRWRFDALVMSFPPKML
jgi:hypothetical protein